MSELYHYITDCQTHFSTNNVHKMLLSFFIWSLSFFYYTCSIFHADIVAVSLLVCAYWKGIMMIKFWIEPLEFYS